MLRWNEPASFVKGSTASVRQAWSAIGIRTVGDLLLTLPRRYDDYSKIRTVVSAVNGEVVTLKGRVVSCKETSSFRRRIKILRLVFRDETGTIVTTFFNQPWIKDELVPDREIYLSGKVLDRGRYGKTLAQPIWEPAESNTLAAAKIAPVYGLSGTLAQKTYRRLMRQALETVEWPQDPLTKLLREGESSLSFRDAVRAVHEPESIEHAESGRKRLALEELLIMHLGMARMRKEGEETGAPSIPFDEPYAKRFVDHLPYPLTGDQKRAVWAALKNMGETTPMRRLLQGDVGSGKTVVAAFLGAMVHRGGASAAILSPTDILARQHAATLQRLFAVDNIPLLLVTRTEKRMFEGRDTWSLETEDLEKRVRQGNVILVGTHALLEEHRLPQDLALAVIDEQHRFGVVQREMLVKGTRKDGKLPHLLSMTATPIPRSLALTFYGDLDVSLIREKPVGRQAIRTFVKIGEERDDAYEAIRQAVGRGERAYIVCPLIDASDVLGVRSVLDEHKRLTQGPLAGIGLSVLHGRMKPKEKEEVMRSFVDGKSPVLIATSVIEVGVDVPLATVIAIEGSDRFGLAQLHQLRGRVGRSHLASTCFLLTDAEGPSLERLHVLERVQDGFTLAEEDLRLRGAGRVFGIEQSGGTGWRAARWSDLELMGRAKGAATRFLSDTSTIDETQWPMFQAPEEGTEHLE